jgi:hypothetical protein
MMMQLPLKKRQTGALARWFLLSSLARRLPSQIETMT